MRILMLGFNEVGIHLVPLLVKDGHHVCVIDSDPRWVEYADNEENMEGFLANGPMMDNLREAGINNADVFLALTNNDNRNAMAAQVAQRVFRVPKVLCRIDNPGRQQVYEQLGLRVVSPTVTLVEGIHIAVKD